MMASRFHAYLVIASRHRGSSTTRADSAHFSGPYGGSAETYRAFGVNGGARNSRGFMYAGASNSVELGVLGWMGSAGHRENILRPNVRYIGVGVTMAWHHRYNQYRAHAYMSLG